MEALPYLTRCSMSQVCGLTPAATPACPQHTHTHTQHQQEQAPAAAEAAAPVEGPVPDSVGHIFVRWLGVAKEVGYTTALRVDILTDGVN